MCAAQLPTGQSRITREHRLSVVVWPADNLGTTSEPLQLWKDPSWESKHIEMHTQHESPLSLATFLSLSTSQTHKGTFKSQKL